MHPSKPCGNPGGCVKPRFHSGLCSFEERWVKTQRSSTAEKLEKSRHLRTISKGRAARLPTPVKAAVKPAPKPAAKPKPTPPTPTPPEAEAEAKATAEAVPTSAIPLAAAVTWALAATAAACAPTACASVVDASMRAAVLLGV